MKNFSKLVFTALFMLAVAPAFSQFSGGVDLAIPSGTLSDFFTVGLGVSARYEAHIESVEKLNWTASAGFLSFVGKSYTTSDPVGFDPNTFQIIYKNTTHTYSSGTIIPLTGGVKYYFQESDKGFYGAADLGLFIYSGGGGSSSSKVGFAPGVGYRLEKFDFTFRFNTVSDANFLGLRAAYIFGGK